MVSESQLERRVIKHLAALDCPEDTPYLRRSTMGKGFGAVDLLLLPRKGRRRLILVEAKRLQSADATCKVVGQLLMYYSAALRFGRPGIEKLHEFIEKQPAKAKSTTLKSLQALVGGDHGSGSAARILERGTRLAPRQIGLYIVMDKEPKATLLVLIRALERHHKLKIAVLVASQRPVRLGHAGN